MCRAAWVCLESWRDETKTASGYYPSRRLQKGSFPEGVMEPSFVPRQGLFDDAKTLDLSCREMLNPALSHVQACHFDLNHQLVACHI